MMCFKCVHVCNNLLNKNTSHCNTLQHTATHCNTLQHTATHCNTLQHTATYTHHNTNKSSTHLTCIHLKNHKHIYTRSMHVYMFKCMRTHIYTYMRVCVCSHIYTYICVCVYICDNKLWIYTYNHDAQTYEYARTYIHMHAYTLTHTESVYVM